MKVLVTGANGMLGQQLVRRLIQEGKFHVFATGRGTDRLNIASGGYTYVAADLSDFRAVEAMVKKIHPHIIVHAGGMTQPNECAADAKACWRANVGGTRALLKAATQCKSFFIYVSTDFVFDGEAGPYDEQAVPNPVNGYGESKLLAEEIVQWSNLPWTIVRTITVYGPASEGGRTNFVTRVQDQLSKGMEMKVVNDQWRTPTYVQDLAKAILLVMLKNARGIFHVSGKEMLTPYQLGCMLANMLQLDASLLLPVSSVSLHEPAKRPPKTGFIITKAIRELGFVPTPLEEGLKKTFGLI